MCQATAEMVIKTARILRDWVHEDARRWRVPARAAEVVLFFPIVGGVVIALSRLDRDLFFKITEEDFVLEWSQAALLLAAAVFGLCALRALSGRRRGRQAFALCLCVIGCIAVAGEEISWGQRIVGLETPDRLEEVNLQDELNVHNIFEVRMVLKFAMIGVGLYGFAVPWLVRMRILGPVRRLTLVPPLFLTPGFLVLAGYNLGRLVFFPHGFFGFEERGTLARFGEWPEFCLGLALASYTFLVWRRLLEETAAARLGRDAGAIASEASVKQPVTALARR